MPEKGNHDVTVTLPSDREIVFTRMLDRPRHLLFEAWTRPEHLRQWWGCEGSRLTLGEIDLRPGGTRPLVIRMADGSEHCFHGVYREVAPSERLVYTECYEMPSIGSPDG
jgi:uncharacterized protein YndB with AHSA1/START domain